jgi:hypothetical protein
MSVILVTWGNTSRRIVVQAAQDKVKLYLQEKPTQKGLAER